MNKRKEFVYIIIIGLVLLTIGFIFEIIAQLDYQKRVQSGNDRWEQVEERIKKIEEKCGCDGRNSTDNF